MEWQQYEDFADSSDSPTSSYVSGTSDTLTDRQERALSVLYLLSSLLSIAGSSTIIFKVVSNRRKVSSYDRLMLGISASDLVGSFGYALYPFIGPRETSPRIWAIGSDATCNFAGFLTQLGFAAVIYNGFLSFYYLLTIRYMMPRQKFAKKVEPYIHAFAILFPAITASVGAGMGFYSEVQVGFGCWVNDYPRGCVEDCLSEEIGWFFAGTPVFFSCFALIINHSLVYLNVRKVFNTVEVVNFNRIQRQNIQKREVAVQGFLYVGSFFFCFWSPIGVRGIEAFSYDVVDESKIYWILVCQAFMLPLQGFLNMLVYNVPNFKRVRAAYPEISYFGALAKACFNPDIPKLIEISNLSNLSNSKRNKYKNNSNSGSAFSSNLFQIREISIEEEDSAVDRSLSASSSDGPGSLSEDFLPVNKVEYRLEKQKGSTEIDTTDHSKSDGTISNEEKQLRTLNIREFLGSARDEEEI